MIARLRSALSGNDAFSITTWIVLIPWTYVIALSYRTTPTSSLWVLIVAPITAHSIGGLFLWAGHKVQPKLAPAFWLLLTLVMFLLYGIARALTLAAIRSFDNPEFFISTRSLVPGTIVSFIWLIILTFMVHYGRINLKAIDSLEKQGRETLFESHVLRNQIDWINQELPAEVRSKVNKATKSLKDKGSNRPAREDKNSLTSLLDDYLRPLSRELKDSRYRAPVDMRRSNLLFLEKAKNLTLNLTRGRPFAPLTTAFACTVTGIPPVVIYSDFIGILYALLIIPAGVTLLVLLAGSVYDAVKRFLPTGAQILLLVVLWTLPGYPVGLVLTANPATNQAFQFLPYTSIGLAVAVGFATAIYFTVIEQRDEKVWSLTRENRTANHTKEVLRQKLKTSQNRLVHLIHGRLQGQLNALAVHLKRNSEIDVQATLQEIESTLEQLNSEAESSSQFNRNLELLIKMWNRVCDINIKISQSSSSILESQPTVATATIEVLREVINNSIKHGQPSWINIIITSGADPAINITMTNDGELLRPPETGVGTDILNDFCIEWSIKKTRAGTRFNAKIVCL
jgi:two-component sensor histidine kinase